MNHKNVDGIILAAGLSSRAKTNKMLLELNGKFLIEHTIEGMRPFVNKIYVITGHYDQELREALKNIKDINFIYNENYMKGMYGSILCGLRNTENDILLIPGDVSCVKPSTYQAVLSHEGNFVVPAYKGQTGHPIFISKNLRSDILAHPNYPNMRTYRNEIGFETVDVDDIYVTLDVDNLDDLNNLKKVLERN